MGLFRDIKQGVGLTIGNKLTESGISGTRKAFRAVSGGVILFVLAGGVRTVSTGEVFDYVEADQIKSGLVGTVLKNSWQNVVDVGGKFFGSDSKYNEMSNHCLALQHRVLNGTATREELHDYRLGC